MSSFMRDVQLAARARCQVFVFEECSERCMREVLAVCVFLCVQLSNHRLVGHSSVYSLI